MLTYIYNPTHPYNTCSLVPGTFLPFFDFLGFHLGRQPLHSFALIATSRILVSWFLDWLGTADSCSILSRVLCLKIQFCRVSLRIFVALIVWAPSAMDERIPAPPFFQYSPSGVHSSPHHQSPLRSSASERERYLAELLAERQKLAPFMQVLPFCNRLLNQEILRVSSLPPNPNFVEPERIDHGSPSPLRIAGHPMNGQPMDIEGWSGMQTEHLGVLQSSSIGWNGAPGPGVVGSPIVKKVVRIDVPVDKYPNFNFVGRLLGPRGNSLKRVEGTTQCRVFIRGRGSVKDSVKEDKLRDKPGYEHLNDPLHVLVEAEFAADIVDARLNQAVAILEDLLKPVDESMDYYKKQQLRELAILNGTLREESPSPRLSPSLSPFNSTGMKRAKTGR